MHMREGKHSNACMCMCNTNIHYNKYACNGKVNYAGYEGKRYMWRECDKQAVTRNRIRDANANANANACVYIEFMYRMRYRICIENGDRKHTERRKRV